jgi:hypothetical protein
MLDPSRPYHSRFVAVFAAGLIVVASCGGGSDDDDGSRSDVTGVEPDSSVADSEDDNGDDSGGSEEDSSEEGGAVEGALVSLLSFEFGLYALERGTGEYRELSIDGVGFTDRETQPLLAGDAAYTLTLTTLEGQSFSHEVGVARFELATGEGTEILQLGIDRTDDESEDLTTYEVVGADATSVWVRSGPFFGDPAENTYTRYDIASGSVTATLTGLTYEEASDSGTCSDAVRDPIITPGGDFVALSFGWPVGVDTGSGAVSPLVVSCLDEAPTLLSLVGADAAGEFFVPRNPGSLSPETVELLAGSVEPTVANGTFVEGDGSLWWVFNSNVAALDGDQQISTVAGGVVEFDLDSQTISNVWPLGDAAASWLDDAETLQVSTLSQADLRYLDGSLWIMDWREDAPLRRIDTGTGELTEIVIPLGEGFDLLETRMISNDPEAIWLDVTRRMVTSDDEGGRSTSGEGFIDQIDAGTDTVVVSVAQGEILGF